MADFLLITGDAWVDHPSFGGAVIAAILKDKGYSVDILAQPEWHDASAFAAFERPRLAALVTSGNIDSMVAHYTVAKKRRKMDYYSPGGKAGLRPDRAVIVYSGRVREAFPGLPVVLGGLEASLRRFAHYDYWSDAVRRSVLFDSGADILAYGMGERAISEIALRLNRNQDLSGIHGTCVLLREKPDDAVICDSFEDVSSDKLAYARAAMLQYKQHDSIRGKTVCQAHGGRWLVCYKPAEPLTTQELDYVAELPYTRLPDPSYTEPVPSIEEVRFSVIHNRGCFGGCNFCSLAFHQGRRISVRSHESLLREVKMLTKLPDFKGYIHDVGGPTANFRHTSCKAQDKNGMCSNRNCLTPEPCPQIDPSHDDFLELLRKLRKVSGVKKVFIRSGIRYDYLLLDKSGECMREMVEHHISGQLKIAPEHCVDSVLDMMGKPHWDKYIKFANTYEKLNKTVGKNQFLVPYLISSHPGSRLKDAVRLAETLNKIGRRPEQVQDFYPTPGTLATCMYYTGLDPRTMKPVYVAKTPHEKALQRVLLQWFMPKNRSLVLQALREAGREDLIGTGKDCLVAPYPSELSKNSSLNEKNKGNYNGKNGGKDKKDRSRGKFADSAKPRRGAGRNFSDGKRSGKPEESTRPKRKSSRKKR